MEKNSELKEYLKNVLKTAKKLGVNVQPGGGYSMGYDMNNLPPYPVGLFGALSIVEGAGARCKLGLTFDQTQSLEAGFNGCEPNAKNKKKKIKRNFKTDEELFKIGVELARMLYSGRPGRLRGISGLEWNDGWNSYEMPLAMPPKAAMPAAPMPAAPVQVFNIPATKAAITTTATTAAAPFYISYTSVASNDAQENALEKKIAAKKIELEKMVAQAQPAPAAPANPDEQYVKQLDKLYQLVNGNVNANGDIFNEDNLFKQAVLKKAADILKKKVSNDYWDAVMEEPIGHDQGD